MSAPAGFWPRYAAWSFDALLIAIPTALLTAKKVALGAAACREQFGLLLAQSAQALGDTVFSGQPPRVSAEALLQDPGLRQALAATQAALLATALPPVLVFALLGGAYHIVSEASARKGSWGKRLNGLAVVDAAGRPLKALHAAGRYVAGTASWATLNLGHLLAAWPPHHRALHDRLAGTRVVALRAGRLSKGARAWLWTQAVLAVVASAWLATRAAGMAQAALERSLY